VLLLLLSLCFGCETFIPAARSVHSSVSCSVVAESYKQKISIHNTCARAVEAKVSRP
jgi:hypothetical protein